MTKYALPFLLLASSCATAAQSATDDAPMGNRGAQRVDAPADFFGLSPDEPTFVPREQAKTIRALGAGFVRFQVNDWSNPGSRTNLDALVDAARKEGLAVLLELNYATVAVSGSDAERIAYWHAGFTDAGNAFSAQFTAAAKDVASRYAGRVARYEIWNEPNAPPDSFGGAPLGGSASDSDWDGACGAYLYGHGNPGVHWALCPRQLAVITTNSFRAIKEVDASAQVVAANVLFHGENGWVGKEYLRAFEAAPAVDWHRKTFGRSPWDVIGIHPYYNDPRSGRLQARIAETKSILAAASDPQPLAISEYGWESRHDGDDNDYASLDDQASFLRDTHAVARAEGLAFVMWFNYQSSAADDFGLLAADGVTWKPAARAYCEVTGTTRCPVPGSAPPPASPPPPPPAPPPAASGDSAIAECVARNGGNGNVGWPHDNGGGAAVHRWGAGNVQDFAGGAYGPAICLHGDSRTRAWLVRGDIRSAYFAAGGGEGWLGYPVEDERGSPIGEVQRFEHGFIGPEGSAYVAQPGDPPKAPASPPPPAPATPSSSCPCLSGIDNFCNYPNDTPGCPMTAAGGYCRGTIDWGRGWTEHKAQCG